MPISAGRGQAGPVGFEPTEPALNAIDALRHLVLSKIRAGTILAWPGVTSHPAEVVYYRGQV